MGHMTRKQTGAMCTEGREKAQGEVACTCSCCSSWQPGAGPATVANQPTHTGTPVGGS